MKIVFSVTEEELIKGCVKKNERPCAKAFIRTLFQQDDGSVHALLKSSRAGNRNTEHRIFKVFKTLEAFQKKGETWKPGYTASW